MSVITFSREFGSGGELIARLVAEKLGFLLVNKSIIVEGLAANFGIDEPELNADEKVIEGSDSELYNQYISALHEYLYDLAIRKDIVILGRGGQILFNDFPPSLHVKVISPISNRIRRIMKSYSLSEEVAHKLIAEQDSDRSLYLKNIFGQDWLNTNLYDLIINTKRVSLEDAADMVVAAFNIHARHREIISWDDESETEEIQEVLMSAEDLDTKFMHPSEEEFTKMLDFYRIKWEYEPKTFPLEWDSEGNITEAMSPDFYLPEQDVYVEITTQKQKLVWKKNKKIRRLKELYPEVNIKIIYGKDYKSLLKKFNLDDRSAEN